MTTRTTTTAYAVGDGGDDASSSSASSSSLSSSSHSSRSMLEQLCDDELALILTFCDFVTAVRFACTTCRSLRRRLFRHVDDENNTVVYHPVWKTIHCRHGFADMNMNSNNTINYLEQCRRGRQLDQNLFQYETLSSSSRRSSSTTTTSTTTSAKRRAVSKCFHLPHRYFHFVPILPPPSVVGWNERDPPPVDWDDASFQFTQLDSGGGGDDCGEYLWFDPYDGSLSVRCLTPFRRSRQFTLLGAFESYVSVPSPLLPPPHPQIECWHLGLNIRPILHFDSSCSNHHPQVVGNMVAFGKSFLNDQIHDGLYCGTELRTWRWYSSSPTITSTTTTTTTPRVVENGFCRVPCLLRTADICTATNRLYVTLFAISSNQIIPRPHHHKQQSSSSASTLSTLEELVSSPNRDRCVAAFPFLPCRDDFDEENSSVQTEPSTEGSQYVSNPLFILECQHDVCLVKVDTSGTIILVGTVQRTLEIWQVPLNCRDGVPFQGARCLQVIDIPACSQIMATPSSATNNNNSTTEYYQPTPNPAPVESLYQAQHLSLFMSGFVTLQHSQANGSTLLLWMSSTATATHSNELNHNNDNNNNCSFQVVTQINLPLSTEYKPQIHYNGRRLIVYGKDHIGMILLVYHVLTSSESVASSSIHHHHHEPPRAGYDSAGIYHFCNNHPRVLFANRIRHVALGGFGRHDSIYMTCNERYIMINTKAGHLLDSFHHHQDESNNDNNIHGAADGLLVIDLLDDENNDGHV